MELLRRPQERYQVRLDADVAEVVVAFVEAQSCAVLDGSSSRSVPLGHEGC